MPAQRPPPEYEGFSAMPVHDIPSRGGSGPYTLRIAERSYRSLTLQPCASPPPPAAILPPRQQGDDARSRCARYVVVKVSGGGVDAGAVLSHLKSTRLAIIPGTKWTESVRILVRIGWSTCRFGVQPIVARDSGAVLLHFGVGAVAPG